jgi:hypothetical protein
MYAARTAQSIIENMNWRVSGALNQRFLSDPHAVLAEHGMDVPIGMNVNVVEHTDATVHVTVPASPLRYRIAKTRKGNWHD